MADEILLGIEKLIHELEVAKSSYEMGLIGIASARRVSEPLIKRINEIRLTYYLSLEKDFTYMPITFESYFGIID